MPSNTSKHEQLIIFTAFGGHFCPPDPIESGSNPDPDPQPCFNSNLGANKRLEEPRARRPPPPPPRTPSLDQRNPRRGSAAAMRPTCRKNSRHSALPDNAWAKRGNRKGRTHCVAGAVAGRSSARPQGRSWASSPQVPQKMPMRSAKNKLAVSVNDITSQCIPYFTGTNLLKCQKKP